MIKDLLEKNFLNFILVFFLISDFISKIGYTYNVIYLDKTNLVFKSILILVLIITTLKNMDKKIFKIFLSIFLILLFYIIGCYFDRNSDTFFFNLGKNFKIFLWYIYPLLLISYLLTLSKVILVNQVSKIFIVLDKLLYIQIFTITFSIIFDIDVFKSYSNRFGYNGVLINVSQTTYIYIFLILAYFYKLIINPNHRSFILFFMSLLLGLLTGTKALLLFNIIFLTYIFVTKLKHIPLSFIFKFLLFVSTILIFTAMLFFILNNKLFLDILHEKGVLNMLTSFRYSLFTDSFLPYIDQNWTIFNFLFGGSQFFINRTEFEIIDLFWFFGILGSFYYAYLFNKYIINLKEFIINPYLLFLFFIICLSGSFLTSITTTTFFIIFLIYTKKLKI